eukprot:351126-Chlamydomonas_euryale.AAC.5
MSSARICSRRGKCRTTWRKRKKRSRGRPHNAKRSRARAATHHSLSLARCGESGTPKCLVSAAADTGAVLCVRACVRTCVRACWGTARRMPPARPLALPPPLLRHPGALHVREASVFPDVRPWPTLGVSEDGEVVAAAARSSAVAAPPSRR